MNIIYITAILVALNLSVFAEENVLSINISNAKIGNRLPIQIGDLDISADVEIGNRDQAGCFAGICSVGGNFLDEAGFIFNDGKKIERVGVSMTLQLGNPSTIKYVYVPHSPGKTQKDKGDGDDVFKKIDSVRMSIEREWPLPVDSIDVKNIKEYRGTLMFYMHVYSLRTQKFVPYEVRVRFSASRDPRNDSLVLDVKEPELREMKRE